MSRTAVSCLPPSLPPRGLSRGQAAEYIGVGVTKFDELVNDGQGDVMRARRVRPQRVVGLQHVADVEGGARRFGPRDTLGIPTTVRSAIYLPISH